MNKKTIAVDFDGVIHKYSEGWKDGSIYDDPVEDSIKMIKLLKHKGYEIIVFTAREANQLIEVTDWLIYNGFPNLTVTNIKPQAIAYIDDRGIRFTNWNDIVKYFA